LHNKPLGCGASEMYASGPACEEEGEEEEEEEEEEKKKKKKMMMMMNPASCDPSGSYNYEVVP